VSLRVKLDFCFLPYSIYTGCTTVLFGSRHPAELLGAAWMPALILFLKKWGAKNRCEKTGVKKLEGEKNRMEVDV
jgi:hypothetical protein